MTGEALYADLAQVVHALNSAASSVAPVFQSTIIAKLPGPLQTVWSDLSSPAAFTLGFTQGMADGTMSVFNQMADSIPALASTASSVTSCAIFMSCSGLASDLSSAAQAVSTADPAKIIDSAKHFALDPFADIANHASQGDWNGAGVASGHAAVGVVQAALAVSGICEAVMADSCFLPTIADMMDLVDAADAVTGVDPDLWTFPTTDADVPLTGQTIPKTTGDLYVGGPDTANNLTPRLTDTDGLSSWDTPESAMGNSNKAVCLDSACLADGGLEAYPTGPDGHYSIVPSTPDGMSEWLDGRAAGGQYPVSPYTEHLRTIGTITRR